MDDAEIKKDLILRDLYYSPKTGFRSAGHIYDLAKKEDPEITKEEVEDWMKTQATYKKYKTFNNPHFYRRTFVRYLGEQVQMDLTYLGKKFESKEYKFILIAVEILSRFGFAVPLKKRDGPATLEGIKVFLKEFEDKFHEKPKLLQFDKRGEFLNEKSRKFFEEEEITTFLHIQKEKQVLLKE